MATSPNIRIAMELHERAEKIALLKSANDQKIINKNEVLRLAVELGLETLEQKYGNSKTPKNKSRNDQ